MKKLFLYLTGAGIFFSCQNNMEKQQAEYAGADLTGKAHVERDKESKEAKFVSELSTGFTVYAGPSADRIDFNRPILSAEGAGEFSLDVPDSVRSYFQLIAGDDKSILTERHLPMAGGYNFRDLGGYRTRDGRYVKWGRMFRSDDLHHLTDEDLTYLESIPVRRVVDFRSRMEMDSLPDRVPQTARRVELSISPGNLSEAVLFESITPERADTLMMEMNRLLVSDSLCIGQYREFFRMALHSDDLPLMFHCSAGKDRTGMAAAVFLLSLGVDMETVMEDYLLSNRYLGDKYAPYIEKYPALAPLFEVKEDFLRAGIDQICRDHGTVENYLRNVLEVDIEKMRSEFLY